MTWQEEAAALLRRGNALLFEKKSLLLAPLAAELEGCGRRRTAFWALDLAEEIAGELKARMPEEGCPAAAVAASRAWAAGALRMPAVRPLILACHAAARETDRENAALCHAVAQGCSTVHARGHALGLPIYELTALALRFGLERGEVLEARAAEYLDRLRRTADRPAAAFLKD